jgi:hypothetical protein
MGHDLLDLTFRAERAFAIRMPRDWMTRHGVGKNGHDATLGQFHELLLELCREQNVTPPAESWREVTRIVADATGAEGVTPDTTLKEVAPYG